MAEIVAAYASGLDSDAVARQFGCPSGSVRRMVWEAGYSRAGRRTIAPRKESIPIVQRLDEFIMPEPNTGCHLWMAGGLKCGYGIIYVDGRPMLAHRFMYERAFGAIPPGLLACHRCDTPPCVNPDHIFLGTTADNNADRDRKGRQINPLADANRSKTHCANGHPFSGDNLYVHNGAHRMCRACQKARRSRTVPSERAAVERASTEEVIRRHQQRRADLRETQSALASPFRMFGQRAS